MLLGHGHGRCHYSGTVASRLGVSHGQQAAAVGDRHQEPVEADVLEQHRARRGPAAAAAVALLRRRQRRGCRHHILLVHLQDMISYLAMWFDLSSRPMMYAAHCWSQKAVICPTIDSTA